MPENDAVMKQNAPKGTGRDITEVVKKKILQTVFWSPEDGMETVRQWIQSSAVYVKCKLEAEKMTSQGVPVDPRNLAQKIIADFEARAKMGESKYGERLKAFNGRKPLIDLYQELLDAWLYSEQDGEETNVEKLQRAQS